MRRQGKEVIVPISVPTKPTQLHHCGIGISFNPLIANNMTSSVSGVFGSAVGTNSQVWVREWELEQQRTKTGAT